MGRAGIRPSAEQTSAKDEIRAAQLSISTRSLALGEAEVPPRCIFVILIWSDRVAGFGPGVSLPAYASVLVSRALPERTYTDVRQKYRMYGVLPEELLTGCCNA